MVPETPLPSTPIVPFVDNSSFLPRDLAVGVKRGAEARVYERESMPETGELVSKRES